MYMAVPVSDQTEGNIEDQYQQASCTWIKMKKE